MASYGRNGKCRKQAFYPYCSNSAKHVAKICYLSGIALGRYEKSLFEFLNEELKDKGDEYARLMEDPAEMNRILAKGTEKAREQASSFLKDIRMKVGIGPMAR